MGGRRFRIIALVALAAILVGVWWWRQQRPAPQATASVYFVRAEGVANTLQAVPRRVEGRTTEARLAGAMRELLAGPTPQEQQAGLLTVIPRGTRLRGVRLENGTVVVDLSGDVESGGGSSSMLGRLWQIVYTATQLPQLPRVRILIDGQVREAMGGEGVLIDRPLERPPAVPVF